MNSGICVFFQAMEFVTGPSKDHGLVPWFVYMALLNPVNQESCFSHGPSEWSWQTGEESGEIPNSVYYILYIFILYIYVCVMYLYICIYTSIGVYNLQIAGQIVGYMFEWAYTQVSQDPSKYSAWGCCSVNVPTFRGDITMVSWHLPFGKLTQLLKMAIYSEFSH